MRSDWLSFDANNARAGFRLKKVEVLNWGTFHGRVHRIAPDGSTALLTGHNGSGKSTLVDALTTLLVPNRHQQRSYNLAAGEGKKERSERSYVLGAYGSKQSEDSNRAQTRFLREPGDISVILASFHNEGYQQDVTLVQLLYIQGEGAPEHDFYVAERELSIAADFSLEGSPDRLRHDLQRKYRDSIRYFPKFSGYCAHFRNLLHLESEKALDLFNQTVSIKEVNDLSVFLRTHMLERPDVSEQITELRQNYEDLSKVYERIQKERQMLAGLEPITSRAAEYRSTESELCAWRKVEEELDAYFAREHTRLLEEGRSRSEQDRVLAAAKKERLDAELTAADEDRIRLEVARRQNAAGQRIAELENQIKTATEERKQRQKNATDFSGLLAKIEIKQTFAMEAEFLAVRQQIEKRHEQVKKERAPIYEGIAGSTATRQQKKARQDEVEKELRSLGGRRDLIPESSRRVRAGLLEALHASAAEIPFVGELIQVKTEAEKWEPAIEKLLRGFALGLLVPAEKYQRAADAYFDATDLKARAGYDPVGSLPAFGGPARIPADSLLHKLEFQRDHPLSWWIEQRIAERFNYLCTDDLERFAKADLAVTSGGLIKSGRTHRIKDDRHSLGDRSQYVLGWTNERKIEAFRTEFRRLAQEVRSLDDTIAGMQKRLRVLDEQLTIFGVLSNVTSFSQVDPLSLLRRIEEMEQEKTALETTDNSLAVLNAQIADIKKRIDQFGKERDDAIRDHDRLSREIKNHGERIKRYEFINDKWKALPLEEVAAKAAARSVELLSLENLTDLRDALRREASDEIKALAARESQLREDIVRAMVLFREKFGDERGDDNIRVLDYADNIGALDVFCGLASNLEFHGLPAHEEQFRKMLKNNVVRDIALFQRGLESHVGDIREHVGELNRSLRELNYTEETYIELLILDAGDRRVQEFRTRLRSCIEGSINEPAEHHEARFVRIKELIDLFTQQPDWTRHVTDVRQWLDFAVLEKWRADNTQKNYFDGSGGRSGGQKAKMAFTILASAIAYQFGLRPGETRSRSFRFVAVDEMFSKSDDDNSRYALELFRKLDLQLLIVCPFDAKALIVEPFVERYHFAVNPTEAGSEVFNLSVQQWEEKKIEMREARVP